MTIAQQSIQKYILKNFHASGVALLPVGKDCVKVTDVNGESMTLTMNLFRDIMDADTKSIYAISDLPHEVDKVGFQMPRSWTEVDRA